MGFWSGEKSTCQVLIESKDIAKIFHKRNARLGLQYRYAVTRLRNLPLAVVFKNAVTVFHATGDFAANDSDSGTITLIKRALSKASDMEVVMAGDKLKDVQTRLRIRETEISITLIQNAGCVTE